MRPIAQFIRRRDRNLRLFRALMTLIFAAGWVVVHVRASEGAVSAYRGTKPSPFDVAVERGMSRASARTLAGNPDACVGPDIWVYADCRLAHETQRASTNNTLLIAFNGNVVTAMKLVPIRVIRDLVGSGRITQISSKLRRALNDTAESSATR